ncbi:uncharacterized protein LALA0_S01e06458g [Lachancea lanzarotensis]|uniref:LALA0S01e06458g1_1 n=1 Tax=Lachancea lanzarotensis TaxID=1245769 RepID=A0A0C7N150_9SACH|nr:uncharacterized protein LALA0_S01e06458g [Lachancea lanzarotensis]CEP60252.1 LALA0S01e06458g1_1 [Lachancea lanzarotensis]
MKVLRSKDTNVHYSKARKAYKVGKKSKLTGSDKKLIQSPTGKGSVDKNAQADLDKENIDDPWDNLPSDSENLTQIAKLESLPSPTPLSQHTLEQVQFVLCEKEMETMPCSHPFCEKLRAVKLTLPEFRNLLLFDFEMIPKQFESEMVNLRNGCYRQQVYRGLWPDWKLSLNGEEKSENYQDFPLRQLFIGESSPGKLKSTISSLQTSDRVRSRRLTMPRSQLARRNQVTDFNEPFDSGELLRDSSSLSMSIDGQQTEAHHFEHKEKGPNRRSRLACLLSKEPRKTKRKNSV